MVYYPGYLLVIAVIGSLLRPILSRIGRCVMYAVAETCVTLLADRPNLSYSPVSLSCSDLRSESSSESHSEIHSEFTSEARSDLPSESPSEARSDLPSESPSEAPSESPSENHSKVPSESCSESPKSILFTG